MLKPQYRLKKRRDFNYIYRRRRSKAARRVAMSYVKVRNKQELLIGFSVSKKVGNAVTRNRVKRLMRESVRLNMDRIPRGYRVIFTARVAANQADYHQINGDIKYLIRTLKPV